MVSKKVPVRLVPNGVYQSNELPEAAQSELQDHCSLYCLVDWNTGIGIIEAADSMVQEAVSNGNIPEPPVPVKLKP